MHVCLLKMASLIVMIECKVETLFDDTFDPNQNFTKKVCLFLFYKAYDVNFRIMIPSYQ